MNDRFHTAVEIIPVLPADRAEALRLLFGQSEAQQRLDAWREDAVEDAPPPNLLGAFRPQGLVGAALVEFQPGKTAVVWPPRTVAGEPKSTASELLDTAGALLSKAGVRLAQALLAEDDSADKVLLEGGFQWLAGLLYLVSPSSKFPTSQPRTSLVFEPYTPENHQRMLRIVDATYRESRDCPELNGVRRIEDVLAGYRCSGSHDPGRWFILSHEEDDVGCLLLTDHPEHENWELIYMGVVDSSRGHGWGEDVTRHAQWLTGKAGRPRLVLAVDAANEPALRVYVAAGFEVWDRRRVYVRVIEPDA